MRTSEHLSALSTGARLNIYLVERVLGAGGFGITYRAREDITERIVAIKEYLSSSLAVRARRRQRAPNQRSGVSRSPLAVRGRARATAR